MTAETLEKTPSIPFAGEAVGEVLQKKFGYNPQHALDPAASVFVSANAGAGKTSLLTNRVLALLLHGVAPSKLLCLTFTNAAAAEMQSRVLEKLGGWVMEEEARLLPQLAALLGHSPDKAALERARSLFARVLEAPEGVRIQTIHGFCQSLLKRFPIEAGISPHFTVVDERTEQALLKEARLRLLIRAQTEDPDLLASLRAIARVSGEAAVQALLAEIVRHKRRFLALLGEPGGLEAAVAEMWRTLGIVEGSTESSLAERHFSYDAGNIEHLRRLCPVLAESKAVTDRNTAQGLAEWLEANRSDAASVQRYLDVHLTASGGKRSRIFTQKALTDDAGREALLAEQERAWAFACACRALETAERGARLLHVAESLLALYSALKNQQALMDYDDLILSASALLHRPGIAPWVLYKLDGGIDHILVDEAQDTSPGQWRIVEALTADFFAGDSGKQQERSLFVVGDEKQSIYSFQGADPAALGRERREFTDRIRASGRTAHGMELTHSYRSAPEILAAVDSIFSLEEAGAGVWPGGGLAHIPTRLEHPGLVELWPLLVPPEGEEETVSPATLLARRVAEIIARWLEDGVALDARGRAVEAGDIMILVRRRSVLAGRLVRALKRRLVPVAGQDRMALADNLAAQDLIALGRCLLLPEDDLTLAALLKSPIIGLDEEALFALAWGRGGESLWERLRQAAARREDCAAAHALLSDLRGRADFTAPYELYAYALDAAGARRRLTGRMGVEYSDAIDEFLGQTLLHERAHAPSLQGFLHWLDASDSEIKRDMEQAGRSVRVLTVHGAKGLQAPIVILPDTVDTPAPQDMLLWRDEGEGGAPLWPVSAALEDPVCAQWRQRRRQAAAAERRRLLYVALTRAEDRLYICGASRKPVIGEQSWYSLVEKGLRPLATSNETEAGEGLRLGDPPSRRLRKNAMAAEAVPETHDDFSFLDCPAPEEPSPPRPLTPSRLPEEPAATSPLDGGAAWQRGRLIHRLLQYLPAVAGDDRPAAARAITAPFLSVLPEAAAQEATLQALRLMDDPALAFLFSEGALAEAPVAGCVEQAGRPVAVAGQIDRLYVGESEVWIVDFKSNRTPPERPADIPAAYLRQMALYRSLMRRIYPEKTIICALLWTATASLTVLDEQDFTAYM